MYTEWGLSRDQLAPQPPLLLPCSNIFLPGVNNLPPPRQAVCACMYVVVCTHLYVVCTCRMFCVVWTYHMLCMLYVHWCAAYVIYITCWVVCVYPVCICVVYMYKHMLCIWVGGIFGFLGGSFKSFWLSSESSPVGLLCSSDSLQKNKTKKALSQSKDTR